LTDLGIDCIVIHVADVPTTQYQEMMKTDSIDAVKLARVLRKGDLRPADTPSRNKPSITIRSY